MQVDDQVAEWLVRWEEARATGQQPPALDELPAAFLDDLAHSEHLCVVEEHVAQGGIGQMIARSLMENGRAPRRFSTRNALGYISGLYGPQKFHRRECGLDPTSILAHLIPG